MTNEDNVIDAQIVDNLPAVIEREASSAEGIQSAAWTAKLEDNESRRCAAHKKDGEQCRKFAIQGATVCRTHGGATRHIKNKARIRVENASNRLMGKLIEFAFDDTKPPDTQLKAIQNALDRAGLKPPTEIAVGPPAAFEEVFEGIAGGTRAESRRARGVAGVRADADRELGTYPSGYADDAPPTQLNGPSPNPPPNPTSPAESLATHGHAVEPLGGYETRGPRPPASTQTAEPSSRDAQQRDEASRRGARSASARHITGDDALRVAAQFTREQLAIESPHKRYKRPQ